MARKKPNEVRAVNRVATLMRDHPALFQGRPFEIPGPFVGAGWLSIADAMCSDLEAILGDETKRFRPIQCKEKWGAMRFYWGLEATPGEEDDARTSALDADVIGAEPRAAAEPGVEVSPTPAGFRLSVLPTGELRRAVQARARRAEQQTERTCMWCGAPGNYWTTGWVHVACERHRRPEAVTLDEWWRREEARRRKDNRGRAPHGSPGDDE